MQSGAILSTLYELTHLIFTTTRERLKDLPKVIQIVNIRAYIMLLSKCICGHELRTTVSLNRGCYILILTECHDPRRPFAHSRNYKC